MRYAHEMDLAARALAEPTRRQILQLVHHTERTASEIAAEFPVSRPAISQHLRVLEDADLVTVRPEGTRRYYLARPEGMAELRAWLDSFWSDRLSALKREAEQEQWRERKQNRKRPK